MAGEMCFLGSYAFLKKSKKENTQAPQKQKKIEVYLLSPF